MDETVGQVACVILKEGDFEGTYILWNISSTLFPCSASSA